MNKRTKSQRALIHRLNGQLLKALNQQLSLVLNGDWKLDDWIINVLLLDRTIEQSYKVRLESSAIYYRGQLFQHWKDCDSEKGVGGLDFEVPLDFSFSGYCIQTGDIVWVEDLIEVIDDPQHPLQEFYRKFEHVAVLPGRNSPTGEYVFPFLVRVGLVQTILGVLNMEYFAEGAPFAKYGQHKLSNIVMQLLYAHGPFLLVTDLPEMSDLVSQQLIAGKELDPATADAQLLKVHRGTFDTRYQRLKKDLEQQRAKIPVILSEYPE